MNDVNDAIRERMNKCFGAEEPLAAALKCLRELRHTEGWTLEEVDAVEAGVVTDPSDAAVSDSLRPAAPRSSANLSVAIAMDSSRERTPSPLLCLASGFPLPLLDGKQLPSTGT